jgi:hypothetical protein
MLRFSVSLDFPNSAPFYVKCHSSKAVSVLRTIHVMSLYNKDIRKKGAEEKRDLMSEDQSSGHLLGDDC